MLPRFKLAHKVQVNQWVGGLRIENLGQLEARFRFVSSVNEELIIDTGTIDRSRDRNVQREWNLRGRDGSLQ